MEVSVKANARESEFWKSLTIGDGRHCSFYNHCRERQNSKWCPDDNRIKIGQFMDNDQFCESNFDFIRPGQCGKILTIVQKITEEYLIKGDIHYPPVPTELVRLADNSQAIEIHYLPLKYYHSALWRLKHKWVIQVRRDDAQTVQRFSLFHEVFHILAHRNSEKAVPVFCSRNNRNGSFNEILANFFAAYTLMPEEWLIQKWHDTKDLDRISKTFNVPKTALCIRLKRLGLI